MKKKIAALYISDVHLGVRENHVKEACRVIDNYEFDRLYLVGDIVDIKELSKKWHWNDQNTEFIHKILRVATKKEVVFIQGNHERNFFDRLPNGVIPIKICRELIVDGKLIIHGDQFDELIGSYQWLIKWGAAGYSLTIYLSTWINKLRHLFGLKAFKLDKAVKNAIRKNTNYHDQFAEAAIKYAKQKKCHTIICGHIHHAAAEIIAGVRYFNCGNFRQDASYLIEHLNGTFESLDAMDPNNGKSDC